MRKIDLSENPKEAVSVIHEDFALAALKAYTEIIEAIRRDNLITDGFLTPVPTAFTLHLENRHNVTLIINMSRISQI